MMDEIYKNMQDDTEYCDTSETEESQIQKFYTDKTILLTGCTGYIGKCLVEKILRTCTDIKRLYVLIRPKTGQTIQQRMEKYLQGVIFQKVRDTNPDILKKLVPIASDLQEPDLGISPEDRRLLIETTDVIIHNAASVMFFAKPAEILRINVLGTSKMLELAGECVQLQTFLYISTAYSHNYNKVIEEKFYESPADLKMVYDMIRADTENESGLSEDVLKDILGKFSNIYTFTKATAEGLVEKYARTARFHCGVFRPSIILSTYKEPFGSWCGNINGPVTFFVSAAIGLLHAGYIRDKTFIDCVPVDMNTNAILAVVWDLSLHKKVGEPCMYNYGSTDVTQIYLRDMMAIVYKHGANYPTINLFFGYFFIPCNSYWTFYPLHIIFHIIPILLYDIFNLLRLQKMRALPLYRKYNKYVIICHDFVNVGHVIKIGGIRNIWERMSVSDHKLFNCDLRAIDWEEYLSTIWLGIRLYLLKDPMETIPAARIKWNRLGMLRDTLAILFLLFFIYCIYFLVYRILGF